MISYHYRWSLIPPSNTGVSFLYTQRASSPTVDRIIDARVNKLPWSIKTIISIWPPRPRDLNVAGNFIARNREMMSSSRKTNFQLWDWGRGRRRHGSARNRCDDTMDTCVNVKERIMGMHNLTCRTLASIILSTERMPYNNNKWSCIMLIMYNDNWSCMMIIDHL